MNCSRDAPEDAWRLKQAVPLSLGRLMNTEPSLVVALRDSTRTGERLAGEASARLGTMPGTISSSQQHLLGMDSATLAAFSTRVGAIRNAAALLRIIDGEILRSLTATLGREVMPLAVRWRHLAAAPPPDRGASLTQEVEFYGLQGLHGWCSMQPPAIGERVRLLLVPGQPGTATEDALGARIVDALVTDA